jgi:hypothetical protein
MLYLPEATMGLLMERELQWSGFGIDALLFGRVRDRETIRDAWCSDMAVGGVQYNAEDLDAPAVVCVVLRGAMPVACGRDRLLPSDHGGRDLTSEGAE